MPLFFKVNLLSIINQLPQAKENLQFVISNHFSFNMAKHKKKKKKKKPGTEFLDLIPKAQFTKENNDKLKNALKRKNKKTNKQLAENKHNYI